MRKRLRRIRTACVRNREARAIQAANALYLVLSRGDVACSGELLGFEYCVHALGRYDLLPFEIEDKGRVLAVENHDVDLLTEHAVAVDDVSPLRLIPLRQVFLQKV